MTWTRRAALTSFAAGAALLGWRWLQDPLDRIFGRQIASHPEARAFYADLTALTGGARLSDPQIACLFLQSSTLAAHVETGEELIYHGLFNPYERPCSNALSATFDPSPPAA